MLFVRVTCMLFVRVTCTLLVRVTCTLLVRSSTLVLVEREHSRMVRISSSCDAQPLIQTLDPGDLPCPLTRLHCPNSIHHHQLCFRLFRLLSRPFAIQILSWLFVVQMHSSQIILFSGQFHATLPTSQRTNVKTCKHPNVLRQPGDYNMPLRRFIYYRIRFSLPDCNLLPPISGHSSTLYPQCWVCSSLFFYFVLINISPIKWPPPLEHRNQQLSRRIAPLGTTNDLRLPYLRPARRQPGTFNMITFQPSNFPTFQRSFRSTFQLRRSLLCRIRFPLLDKTFNLKPHSFFFIFPMKRIHSYIH